ncbi:MAG: nucleotidyltransferase domain-containing protein [Acidobacteriaceae bacterium]
MQPFIAEKREAIAELCRQHHVRRLAIFGSATRDDFDPARSDVDILVEFYPAADASYAENFYSLRDHLEDLLHRNVDLLREGVIRNRYRLQAIEKGKVELYAA